MGHTWKNGSPLEKWVTLRKLGHTWRNKSQLKIWVTNFVKLVKMSHSCKYGSHLEKWVTLVKLDSICKNESQLQNCVKPDKIQDREKVLGTRLDKMGRSCKNGSLL